MPLLRRLALTGLLALGVALATAALPGAARGACYPTEPISEEQPPRSCGRGQVLKGISCGGKYCDNKILLCCTYTGGADPSPRYSWSPFFSEEGRGAQWNMGAFVKGLACNGRYCDNLALQYLFTPALRNTGSCYWSRRFSEEGRHFENCALDHYVAGVQCSGGYCDNLNLLCCRASGGRDGWRDGIVPGGPGKGDAPSTEWPGFHVQQ